MTGLLGHFRPSYPLTRQELESHGIWDFDRSPTPNSFSQLGHSHSTHMRSIFIEIMHVSVPVAQQGYLLVRCKSRSQGSPTRSMHCRR